MKTRTLDPAHRVAALCSVALCFAATGAAHPGHDEVAQSAKPVESLAIEAGSTKAEAAPVKPVNSVAITIEGDYRVIKSNGWPDHAPGAFPRRGNPNALSPQNYSFRVALKPKPAASPERRGGWWWGVALNGVPFEPGTAETWHNDQRSGWRYEAATGFLNLGLDEHNAHVQPNGSYHYHALPTGLVERLGGDGKKMLLVGWAADGFPVYSAWAYAEARNTKSELRKMKPGYRLKQGARPVQEGGPGGIFDGHFTQDFEFVKDFGDLDECNGRTGVTPEFPEGTYYYCLSVEFPFVPRMWRGTPDQSFSKGDRPPGGGPGRLSQGGAPRGILENGSGNPGGAPMPGEGPPPFSPLMHVLDADENHKLDAGEIAKAAEALKSLDKNGDGILTPEEYRPGPPGR